MESIPLNEARRNLPSLINQAQVQPITISRHGAPAAVVISPSRYEELIRALDASEPIKFSEISIGSRLDFLRDNSQAIRDIAAQHKAIEIAVFGSIARGEDGPESDFDFLVTFTPTASLTDLAGLHDSLEEFLSAPVDVVSSGGLKARDFHIREEALIL